MVKIDCSMVYDLLMNQAAKAKKIQAVLDEIFPMPEIPLAHRDPYTLLVATVLSAQCTDARVNQVAPKLFKRASTPKEMIALSVDEIREIIRPCGLAPAKSKAIFGLSQILVERFGGQVPKTFAELEALPGVGHKTASVVVSQAFGEPAFPVDTHIHRLAARWGLSSGKSVVQTERDLKKIFPKNTWNKLHLQIIYFGRNYCPARSHDFNSCPICSWTRRRRSA
jgi:endonuclease-3